MVDLHIPEIKQGDLILVNSTLFYSDGRVAQTDWKVDYHKEKKNIPINELPENLRTRAEAYRENEILKKHWEDWIVHQHNMFADFLISRAIKQGHLQTYHQVFGQLRELDHKILHNGLQSIFGYESERGAIGLGNPDVETFTFDKKEYRFETPDIFSRSTRPEGVLFFATNSIEKIIVGAEAIASEFKGTPKEFYTKIGIIPSK